MEQEMYKQLTSILCLECYFMPRLPIDFYLSIHLGRTLEVNAEVKDTLDKSL